MRVRAALLLTIVASCGSQRADRRSDGAIRRAAAPELHCAISKIVVTRAGASFASASCGSMTADLFWLAQDQQWDVVGASSMQCGGTSDIPAPDKRDSLALP